MSNGTRRTWPQTVGAWLLVAGMSGCAGPGSNNTSRDDSSQSQTEDGEAVVATVNGVPVTARRVAELARQTGRSPREVVDRLISFELLAGEADRRGLRHHREVQWDVRKAMVQRYLEGVFEATHRPEDMPEDVLQAAYQQNRNRFVRPELRKVAHILVLARQREVSEEKRAEAHRLALRIAQKAREAQTQETFLAVAKAFQEQTELPIQAELLNQPVFEHARLVPSFIKAAMALKRPGQISPPVQTQFGSHVIFLVEVLPALNRSFEEVREEVRQAEYPFWQKRSFVELVDGLRGEVPTQGYRGEARLTNAR